MISLLLLVAAKGQTVQHGFDTTRLKAIPVRMRQFVDQNVVAGTVVLVRRHGKTVLFDAQGSARLEPKTPMQNDTVFQVMSMTKPITAIAVVMCAEAGLLSLDDPIQKHLPRFTKLKVRQEDGSEVDAKSSPTIRQLLSHTGGFSADDPAGMDDEQKRKLTLAEYTELLASAPLANQPGEKVRYSGPSFSALGRIVEVVTGMPLERFEEEKIFRPLGMKNTFFFAPRSVYPRLAYTYDSQNGKLVPLEANPFREGAKFANPAGGLYSTAEDMATLLECVSTGGALRGYRLLSPAAVDVMATIQNPSLVDGSDSQGFGLGFAVVKNPIGQMTLRPLGSFGHTGAFGTEFWTDRKRGIVAVFMTQGFDSSARKTFNTMVNAAFVGP
jgi:CubicO group peptidase (beta-lactamase class C family)